MVVKNYTTKLRNTKNYTRIKRKIRELIIIHELSVKPRNFMFRFETERVLSIKAEHEILWFRYKVQ